MSSLIEQLHADIWDKESELNKDYHQEPKMVVLIEMNHKVFHDLKKEVIEFDPAIKFDMDGSFRFEGIPIERTSRVEKWELRG